MRLKEEEHLGRIAHDFMVLGNELVVNKEHLTLDDKLNALRIAHDLIRNLDETKNAAA